MNETWQLTDSVTWTKDRHSIKAGFELLKLRYLDRSPKHIGSFSWLWELPGAPSKNAVVRGVVNGWQVNGLVSARTGLPLNLLLGSDRALSGTPNQRPDVIRNPVLSSDRARGEQGPAVVRPHGLREPGRGDIRKYGPQRADRPQFGEYESGAV